MIARELQRKRISRFAIVAGLVCNMTLAACGTLDRTPTTAPSSASAPQPSAEPAGAPPAAAIVDRAARLGIAVLAPAQSLPVAPAALAPARAIALESNPCRLRPADSLTDASVGRFAPPVPDNPPVADAVPQAASMPADCANLFPDVPLAQHYSFGLETEDPVPDDSLMVMTGVAQPRRPWLSSVGSQGGGAYTEGRWTYRDTRGPALSVGNVDLHAPVWGGSAALGGIQVSRWDDTTQVLSPGQLGYSSTVGRLNYTDLSAHTGAVDYGASAGAGVLRYGLTPALTLESQVQGAPLLSTRGLGSTYSAGQFGTVQLGATESSFDSVNAWRYRFGYNVNLTEFINLAVTNEQIDPGFGDLASYRGGGSATGQTRNTLSAGVPLDGWGTLTGTYAGVREGAAHTEARYGLTHSMYMAPAVQLSVGADRDAISGDYAMRAGISMPVDAFMRGRWLPW